MAQTIQILRTTTNTPPATLLPGAFSVELGTFTKLWIGSAGGNRLLLSSNPADSAMAGAAYLKLLGGTLTGPLALAADPTASLQAATKQYVDVTAGIASSAAPIIDGSASAGSAAAWSRGDHVASDRYDASCCDGSRWLSTTDWWHSHRQS